jgi:putative addiction module component (TIGR02574 family)
MERVELALSKLTLAQKLDLMEAIWDDLAKHERTFVSPELHEEVLANREEALANGQETVSGWEEAKERIGRKASCEKKC